jgi:predicted ArsR family transcriptional regulator
MKYPDLPDHVRRFLLTSVPSVPYLEAVLLLRGQRTPWTPAAVARRLYLRDEAAAELLAALETTGVARAVEGDVPSFVYSPATPELVAMLDDVAKAYATNLVAVTDVIHSRLDRRAQQFADAFRWRKDS